MKLVSLNIYGGIYLEKSLAHLREVKPDVLCLQELAAEDIELLKKELDIPHSTFVPTIRVEGDKIYGFRDGEIGIGILSKTPLDHVKVDYYRKFSDETPVFNPKRNNECNRALLSAEVATARGRARVSTTHFTWTPDGLPSPEQLEDVEKLAEFIQKQNVDILCGDFNAPHGATVMSRIGSVLKDHMPSGVDSTIDEELHRCKGLKIVVDNCFAGPGHTPASVEFQSGASDHKSLIAEFFQNTLTPNPGMDM